MTMRRPCGLDLQSANAEAKRYTRQASVPRSSSANGALWSCNFDRCYFTRVGMSRHGRLAGYSPIVVPSPRSSCAQTWVDRNFWICIFLLLVQTQVHSCSTRSLLNRLNPVIARRLSYLCNLDEQSSLPSLSHTMRDRIHDMSILLLCQFCVFVKFLPFSVATTPPLNIGSLPQPPVAATPPSDLSRNLTQPPSPAATT